MTRGNGTLIAWLSFTTGALVSIGANMLHALDGDGPTDAGRLVAELVARARQSGPWWIVALRWFGTAVVAAVAAIVSYGHMRDLLLSYGETVLVAHLLPLSVDGLLLVASLALASPDGRGRAGRRSEEDVEGVEETLTVEEERHSLPPPVSVPAAGGTRDTVTVPVGDDHDDHAEEIEESVDEREQARQAYRAARAEGVPLTGKELAARYGRSESWGRTRIRECRTA